jgi:hypothetical protein
MLRSLILFSLLFQGCDRSPRPKFVNLTFSSELAKEISWAELIWNGPYITGGEMAFGTSKTAIMAPWPSDTTTATITFIDWDSKERFAIFVTFPEIAEQVRLGVCKHVVFVIEDYDRASVRCE